MKPDPPTQTPSKSRQRLLVAANVVYAAAVLICWFCVRHIADRWWPGTWLSFAPRWPWLLPLAVLLPLARHRKRFWIAPLLTAAFILGPFMGFNVPWHRIPQVHPGDLAIRLLTCNVHRRELSIPNLDAYILETNPDVVALQDYSGWDESQVLRVGWHTFRQGEIFLASRFPIRRAENLNLEAIPGNDDSEIPRYAGAAVCFDLETPRGIVHFVALHLASPHTGLTAFARDPGLGIWKLKNNMVRRLNESESVSRHVEKLTGPRIIAGDFNMLADSPTFRQCFGAFSDAFESTDWGYGYTHYTLVSQLRIDHVLSAPGIDCAACRIGPPCGTPHRPMVVDLIVRGSAEDNLP